MRVSILAAIGVVAASGWWAMAVSAQGIPANARKSTFGSGWECNRGFGQSGNQCVAVEVPATPSPLPMLLEGGSGAQLRLRHVSCRT
jgi:hypothetical protein